MKKVFDLTGPFTKESLRKLRNEVVTRFNEETDRFNEETELYTYQITITYVNGKTKEAWVEIPLYTPEKIATLVIHRVKQKPVVIGDEPLSKNTKGSGIEFEIKTPATEKPAKKAAPKKQPATEISLPSELLAAFHEIEAALKTNPKITVPQLMEQVDGKLVFRLKALNVISAGRNGIQIVQQPVNKEDMSYKKQIKPQATAPAKVEQKLISITDDELIILKAIIGHEANEANDGCEFPVAISDVIEACKAKIKKPATIKQLVINLHEKGILAADNEAAAVRRSTMLSIEAKMEPKKAVKTARTQTQKPNKANNPKAKKTNADKAPAKPKGKGVIAMIAELIKGSGKKGISKEQILEKLVQEFPERSAGSMKSTINVQLPGRMSKERFPITKLENGNFTA